MFKKALYTALFLTAFGVGLVWSQGVTPGGGGGAGGGGGDGAIIDGVSASIKATVLDLANANPITTAIVDSSGTQISSFGGGVQYTEGDPADATMTGTVALMEIAGNLVAPLQGTVADGLLVNLGANNDVVAIGTKTNNDAAPGATNIGVLGAIANTSAPTWTEGNLVTLSVDLTGALRVAGGGGGVQYAEDTLHASGNTGTLALVVRNDAGTALAGDGDNIPLMVNSAGALYVTGAGGGTQYAVDTALGATPTGTLAIAIRDDALSTLTPVEGDAIGLRVGSTGALWTIDTNSAAIAASLAVIDNASAEAAADWITVRFTDGTSYITPATDATFDLAFSASGPQSMLAAVDFDGAAFPNVVSAEGDATRQTGSLYGVAYNAIVNEDGSLSAFLEHDAADTGYLAGVGYRATAHGADPTAVTAGDRTVGYANRDGIPFVLGGHMNTFTREAQIEDADGPQSNAAVVSVSAGTKIVLTHVNVKCDASTTNPTNIVVGFGVSTIPARAHTGTSGIILAFDGVPPGGGESKGNGSGIVGIGADDEDVRITTEDPIGGACSVELTGFTIES